MIGHYTFRVRESDTGWWATCDEVPGYFLSFDTLEELRAEMRVGLRDVLGIEDFTIVEVREEISGAAGSSR